MAATPALSANLVGALWMLVSVAGATGMMVLVRALADDLASPMIVFLRSAVALIFLAPLLRPRAGDAPAPARLRRPGLHLARGLLVAVALNAGFYALTRIPLATATILFFLAPVFSTALAPALLGERVGPRRWAAVAVALGGSVLVLRPGVGAFEPAMLGAVLSSACFAVALLLGKIATREDGAGAVFASTALISAALTLPPALFVWTLPGGAAAWLAVLALAAASSVRAYADIRSFAAGDASFVAPISYLRLPAVGVAAWLLYDEAPDALSLAGGAVIIAATLYIMLRDRRAAGAGPA